MGEAPEWFVLLKVARWLGVPPWELARQPVTWYRMAAFVMGLENQRANQQH